MSLLNDLLAREQLTGYVAIIKNNDDDIVSIVLLENEDDAETVGHATSTADLHFEVVQLVSLSAFVSSVDSDDPFCPHGIPLEFCGNCHEEQS